MTTSIPRLRALFAVILAAAFVLSFAGVSTAHADTKAETADSCAAAISQAAPTGRAKATCFHGTATVTSPSTGESKTYRYDEVRPFVGYVDGLFRGRTEDDLVYGYVQNGQWVWQSRVHVRGIISLGQYRYQWLEVYWIQNDGRDINLSINGQMKRYIYWPGTDEVVDSVAYTSPYYSQDYKKSQMLFTEHSDQQIFYYNLTNLVLKDLGLNDTFTSDINIPGPYFQCYVVASCKYPNGKPVDP